MVKICEASGEIETSHVYLKNFAKIVALEAAAFGSAIEALFDFCIACTLIDWRMSSIPQGMFAATKLREHRNKMVVARTVSNEGFQSQKYFSTKLTELTPLKYNSKLMNSIWGLYNRYSPHNIKRTNDDSEYVSVADVQQCVAHLPMSASFKEAATEAGIKQSAKAQNNVPMLEKFWSTMPISH